ncbi:MAG: GyrI-like domain-containing protein [Burkholderiales bacterium]|jgi:predicted transcriptional regulator YdeE|nr:GyrI-like domain-containing protein [Burkholderiales bacterium]
MKYEVTVVELPAKQLVGLSERISMADAKERCPALWRAFWLRRGEVTDIVENCAYGVSAHMEENGGFDYWATLPVSPTANTPSGMKRLTLRAGKYAKCTIDLASMEEACEFLYGEWAQAQKDHPVDFAAACFERYANDWQETDTFEFYVPLS